MDKYCKRFPEITEKKLKIVSPILRQVTRVSDGGQTDLMAAITRNALSSLVGSLNAAITFAKGMSDPYQQQLVDTITVLENCYLIPSELRIITRFQMDTLRQTLDTLLSSKQTTGLNKEIDDTENKVYDIFREFDRYKKNYINISTEILDKLSSIQEIHEIIERMKDIAREIKLFSINSVVVASQAGNSGIAFKSISRFIIELSDAIQRSASQLEIYRDKILSAHKKIEELFHKLIQDVYEKRASELKAEILAAIAKTKSQFGFMSVVTDNINQRILQALQEGQIAERQYRPGARQLPILEYWNNALNMLSEIPERHVAEDSPSDILASIAYAVHIVNSLSKRMNNHGVLLNSFLTRIDTLYSSLVSKFGLAQQDSMYVFNYFAINTGIHPSFLDRIFSQFKIGLRKLKSLLSEEASVKSELVEAFNEIHKMYSEGLGFFSNFEKFFVIMNNINVLAQIEMSKQDFDGGNNAGLKAKFINMLEQLKFFNEDIKTRIQKMLQSLIVQINNFTDTQSEQADFLLDAHFFLDTQDSRLDFTKQEAKETIDSVRDENPKIFSTENQSRRYLNSFQEEGKVYIRMTADLYSGVTTYQERFLGLLGYYDVNIREYSVNNPLIQIYEKRQAKLLGGTS